MRSRTMGGQDAPYVPGWDCHGLPIELKVDKDLGAKKREMSPLAFRQACREYAEKFVGIQREEFERLGVLGEWDDPYLTMAPAYQATIVRQLAELRGEGPRLQGQEVGALVHLLPHRPGRGRGRVRRAPREPLDRRALPARRGGARPPRREASRRSPASACSPSSGPRRPGRCPPTWRSPSTPTLDYAFYPVEGTNDVLLLAKALRGRRSALAREGKPRRPAALGEPLAEVEGQRPRGRALPPSLDRPRLARACSATTSPSTPAPASSTPPPATAGTTT